LQEFAFQRVDRKRGDFLTIPTPTPGTGSSAAAPEGETDDEPASPDEEAE